MMLKYAFCFAIACMTGVSMGEEAFIGRCSKVTGYVTCWVTAQQSCLPLLNSCDPGLQGSVGPWTGTQLGPAYQNEYGEPLSSLSFEVCSRTIYCAYVRPYGGRPYCIPQSEQVSGYWIGTLGSGPCLQEQAIPLPPLPAIPLPPLP